MSLFRALRVSTTLGKHVTKNIWPCAVQISQRNFADAAGPEMPFTFASPSEMFFNKADVKQVDVPSYSGDFGIMPHHVPCLAVMKPGVVTVFPRDSEPKRYFVSSGTITINDDASVQVLAEQAIPLDRLDPQLCRDGLSKAQSQLSSASSEQAKAEAQILVEVHEAMVKALS